MPMNKSIYLYENIVIHIVIKRKAIKLKPPTTKLIKMIITSNSLSSRTEASIFLRRYGK